VSNGSSWNGVSPRDLPITGINSTGQLDTCVDNLREGNVIDMLLIRKSFHVFVAKAVLLIGKYFKAFVSYRHAHPYYSDIVAFKVELSRFEREVDITEDGNCDHRRKDLDIQELFCLKDVATFAVLPYGDVIVLFADEFCFLHYFSFKVSPLYLFKCIFFLF